MTTRIYVSTLEASYFETQLLGYDNNPPTDRYHTVGDIVLSSVQQNDVLGWVCVKAGNPGEWKVICDIVNIKNSINQNKNDLSKLDGRLTKTEADIQEINIDIVNLNKNVEDNNSDLEDRINENANNISNLHSVVDVNKGDIKNNLNSINDLRTQIEDAKKILNNVGNQANVNSDDIANIERELLEIDNRLNNTDSNNNDLLNTIQNELNNLQKEFDDLKDLVIDGNGDINSVIQNLQQADENINKEINEIKELIADNEADNDEIIEVLQKGVDDNKTEIDDLKQGLIDSLKEKNIDVKDNINWKELFGLLLQGLVKPENPDEPIIIPCTNITLNDTAIHFTKKDATKTLVPTLYPDNATEEVLWSTNNYAVATVNNGVVTSVGQGDCTITARCGSVSASCYVVVNITESIECTSIRFTESSLKIHVDQVTDLKENLVIEPEGCVEPVEWVVDNAILEINNGVIKGLVEGSANVQASCGGLSANINITVVPKMSEDSGEGILLYKAGTQYNDTEFRNLCIAYPDVSLTSDGIYHNLQTSTYVWFSYDGYINYSNYDRIEITAYTENSQQQPMIGLGITSTSGQYGNQGHSNWDGVSHGNVILMYNVTETKYTIPINYTSSRYGYLLLWMHRNNGGVGGVYITEIRVIPKNTEKPCTLLKFSKTTGFKITGSETLNLNDYLVIEPDNCTDPVTWSTDSNVVAVTDGIVTVLSGGNANVQAKCGEYSDTVSVEAIVEDEPIEIIIDEITIKVNETYDATKLYNLQEGRNVQYKYTSIIAIEGEHTIVGKEVGTTELEIICGKIIKTVKVNVV